MASRVASAPMPSLAPVMTIVCGRAMALLLDCGGPVMVDAEGDQVGQAIARSGGGKGRFPVRFQAQVAGRVGAQQPDQDLGHDPAADWSEPVAAPAVLGLRFQSRC
jgi:hypothetical protein